MNRDNTNYLTREDVWRELELLPAWKLRAPVETMHVEQVAAEKFKAAQVVVAFDDENPIEKLVNVNPDNATAIQYEITLSQDKKWAFVCEIGLPEDRVDISLQSTLFNNILYALSIEKPSKIQVESIADVQASVTVALGESVAQVLLKTQEPLENLRGKLHAVGHTQLLATCGLAHLLNNPLDKAQVWQDLCMARSYLQGLHVQD